MMNRQRRRSACVPGLSLTLVYNLKKQPRSRTHQSHRRERPGSLQILTMAAEAFAQNWHTPTAPNKPVVKSRENRVTSVLSPEDSSTCHKTLDKQWKPAERLEEEMDGKHAPLTFNLISLLVGFSQDLLRQQGVCIFP